MGALADAPVDAVFSIQELAFDERTPELAVVGPELTQQGVHLRLRQAFAWLKRPDHFGQD